jgi:polyisoprenoid-binding protein YceI
MNHRAAVKTFTFACGRVAVRLFAGAALAAAFAAAASAQTGTWQINTPESAVQFTARHMMVATLGGGFSKFSGAVQYDPKDVSKTTVQATIDTTSETSGVEGRDKDLKSSNFLEVDKYPTMTFQSTGVESVGGGKLKLSGNLTLHGVTKPVVLDVEGPTPTVKDARGGSHMGFSATTKINRKDFGINFNKLLDNGGAVVSDEVAINLQIELMQPAGK